MFKPKPFWLRWFTSKDMWVTITPNIYIPDGVNPVMFPWVVAHENVHLKQQQSYGKYKWLLNYLFSRHFMLDQEAAGIAAEIVALPAEYRAGCLRDYCIMLSTKDGKYETPWGGVCAETYGEAEDAITLEIARIDPRQAPIYTALPPEAPDAP